MKHQESPRAQNISRKKESNMTGSEILTALSAPFPADAIDWRLQSVGDYEGKLRGKAVPYLTVRAITDRLNEVVGAFNWQNAYTAWHTIMTKNVACASQLCSISIYLESREEWITKTDGAENSDNQPIKGGLSDAFKRAAVKWNIGRYLYDMDGVWVDVEKTKTSHKIPDGQMEKLTTVYKAAVAKQFGADALKALKTPANAPSLTRTPEIKQQSQTLTPTQQAAPQGNVYQLPATGPIYTVTQAKKGSGRNGPNMMLQIAAPSGDCMTAYIQGHHDALKCGVKLKDLNVQEKKGTNGAYYILTGYETAA
jgi:hypothetical protein